MHAQVGAYAVKKTRMSLSVLRMSKHMYQATCRKAEEKLSSDKIYYFAKKKDFLEKWQEILTAGDTVLVKASHGMAFDEIVACLNKEIS